MQTVQVVRSRGGFARTSRPDAWWIGPAVTAAGLLLFFGYLTFRAFSGTYVWAPPYISPTVAPPLLTPAFGYPGAVPVDHAWFGAFPAWWPTFIPQSPAFFLPAFAIAFRITCYYYRGAYYKALFFRPPSCAVGGVPGSYMGERAVLVFQNLHRYTFYAALLLLVFLWEEGLLAFFRDGRFGVGVGTIVMVINASLLDVCSSDLGDPVGWPAGAGGGAALQRGAVRARHGAADGGAPGAGAGAGGRRPGPAPLAAEADEPDGA
jgi:hypothetical protein